MIFSVAKKILRLNTKEQFIILRAIAIGIVFSVLQLVLPFNRLAFFFGVKGYACKTDYGKCDAEKIKLIARVMHRIKRYLPFRFKCLTAAFIAKYLLKKEKIESTLYIGVGKSDDKLNAHAWLECNGYTVTGKEEKNKFTPVVFYT